MPEFRDERPDNNDQMRRYPVVVPMNKKEARFYHQLRTQLRERLQDYQERLGEKITDYLLLLPDLFVQ